MDLYPGMGGATTDHAAIRADQRFVVQIAGDEARRQSETAHRLHHEQGEILQLPEPRSSVWIGVCVPSSSRAA